MNIEELKQLLEEVWSWETCSPGLKNMWNSNNPSVHIGVTLACKCSQSPLALRAPHLLFRGITHGQYIKKGVFVENSLLI